jgi:hypothetical protein
MTVVHLPSPGACRHGCLPHNNWIPFERHGITFVRPCPMHRLNEYAAYQRGDLYNYLVQRVQRRRREAVA